MPRSMADPDYVYRPMPAERRQRIKEANLRNRGIPKGYRMLCGVLVPERQLAEIKRVAAYVKNHSGDDIEVVRTLIRVLVRVRPLIQKEERLRLHRALSILALKELSHEERKRRRHPPS